MKKIFLTSTVLILLSQITSAASLSCRNHNEDGNSEAFGVGGDFVSVPCYEGSTFPKGANTAEAPYRIEIWGFPGFGLNPVDYFYLKCSNPDDLAGTYYGIKFSCGMGVGVCGAIYENADGTCLLYGYSYGGFRAELSASKLVIDKTP